MALPGVIKPSGPREWALVTRSVMAGSRDTSAQTVGHCYVSDDGFVGRRPLLLCCAMCLLLCTQHAVNDRLSGFRCVCQHLVGRWFYPASVPTSTHKLADWLLHPQDARGAPRPGTPGEPWCARTVLTASARQPVSRTLHTSHAPRGRPSGAPAPGRLHRLCHSPDQEPRRGAAAAPAARAAGRALLPAARRGLRGARRAGLLSLHGGAPAVGQLTLAPAPPRRSRRSRRCGQSCHSSSPRGALPAVRSHRAGSAVARWPATAA